MSDKKKLKKLHAAMKELEKAYGKSIEYILVQIIYNCYTLDPGIALEAIQLYRNWLTESGTDVEWFDEEDKPAKIVSLKKENEID